MQKKVKVKIMKWTKEQERKKEDERMRQKEDKIIAGERKMKTIKFPSLLPPFLFKKKKNKERKILLERNEEKRQRKFMWWGKERNRDRHFMIS